MSGEKVYYGNEECNVISREYADKKNLILVDYLCGNDITLYTIFRDENDCYFAAEGE